MKPESDREHLLNRNSRSMDSFTGILESIFDAVVIHCNNIIVFANDSAARLVGASEKSELIGTPIEQYIVPSDMARVNTFIRSLDPLPTDEVPNTEVKLVKFDGSIITTLITGRKVLWQGEAVAYVGVIRDITSNKLIQNSYEQTQSQLNNIINNLDIGIWSYDTVKREMLLLSHSITVISGLSLEQLHRKPNLWYDVIHPDDREEVKRLQTCLKQGQVFKHTYRIIDQATGQMKYVQDLTVPIMDAMGNRIRNDGMVIDVTEKTHFDQKVKFLAYHDELTSLPNRRSFREELIRSLEIAGREEKKLFLAYLDLDKFKMINDSLGHGAGDVFLVAVSERLASISPAYFVARIGGDEFSIIFHPDIVEEQLEVQLRQLAQLFEKPFDMDGYEFYMNISIGVAIYPDHATNYDSLLNCAETAMRLAKQSVSTERYALYSTSCSNQPLMMRMFNDLNKTIANNEFFLMYQPKYSISGGQMSGAEALIRWRHPQMGVLSPDRFIPIVEEFGMMSTVGRWIVHEACSQIRRWSDNGIICQVSINLSAIQFQLENIVDIIKEEIEEADIRPALLGLEITESMAMDIDKSMNTLTRLYQLGVTISIDDFGTGYSSLNYLKRLPIHELKIDRSFINDIEADDGDKAIVTAIVALAHNLRLKVVAEGVETVGQLNELKRIGCDEAQGYYFHKPQLPEDLASQFRMEP
ncbi:sensor domain-containing protein [Paenibacillus soyae]|uniref:EAL domain-containing protein n=1 Tax=Paenibacillus soyae TaxID=2969249 RepID=A0A9X2MTJ9_9BACL|nr:EAL domain-containing protein [Paenibacillus soyae]MCR2807748.1 EAL domain-containing protein [Paenibacillus soyae]